MFKIFTQYTMNQLRLVIAFLSLGFVLSIEAAPLVYDESIDGDLQRNSTTGDCHDLGTLEVGINTITGITTGTTGAGGGPTDFDCFVLSVGPGLKIVDTSLEFNFDLNSTINTNPTGFSSWNIFNSRGLSNFLSSSIVRPSDSSPLQLWPSLLPLNSGDRAVEIGLSLSSDTNIEHSYTLSVTVESLTTSIIIDIKPGSNPNSINLCSNGGVPIAIHGSEAVDVNDIDTEKLRFAEAAVKLLVRKILTHFAVTKMSMLTGLTTSSVTT